MLLKRDFGKFNLLSFSILDNKIKTRNKSFSARASFKKIQIGEETRVEPLDVLCSVGTTHKHE